MMDIYRSLTEDDGQAGILKVLLKEPDLDVLMNNPFKITKNDVQVSKNSLIPFLIYQRSKLHFLILKPPSGSL